MTPILASPHICVCWSLSCVWLFATPWTVAHQNLLSMGFSRQEYGMGSHSPLQGIFPTGIKPRSPALQADSLLSEPLGELIISRKALNPFMMTSALHDKQKTFCKISAWLHWIPSSPKVIYIDLPPLSFWCSFSELSEVLSPRLQSSLCPKYNLTCTLTLCIYF